MAREKPEPGNPEPPQKPFRFLAVLLLAFALRILAAGFGGPITPDGVYFYLPSAEGFLAADLARANPPTHHPGYPAFVGAFRLLGLSPEWAGRWVSILAGTLTVIPVFLIGRRLGGARAGMLAALLLALLPLHVQFSGWVQTEALFGFLAAWSLERMIAFSQGAAKPAIVFAGLIAGIGAMVRGEAILLAPLLWFSALYRPRDRRGWLSVGTGMTLLGVGALTTSLLFHPQLGRLAYSPGSNIVFVLGQQEDRKTRYDCFFRIAPPGDQLEFYYASTREGFEPGLKGRIIREDPGKFLRLYADKLRRLSLSYASRGFSGFWIPALLLGGILLLRRRTPGGALPVLQVMILFLGLSAYFVQRRFWVPLAPATVTCAAVGFAAFFEWARPKRMLFRWIGVGLLLAAGVQTLGVYEFSEGWNASRARSDAADWVESVGLKPGDYVLAQDAHLAFYAGLRTSELPVASFAECLEYAKRVGADGILDQEESLRRRGWADGFVAAGAKPITIRDRSYLYLRVE